MSLQKFEVSIQGGDEIYLTLSLEGGSIVATSWRVLGSLNLINEIQKYKHNVIGKISDFPLPQGVESSQLLLKKLILKVKGQWLAEESDPELCHCRKIPQSHVERAVIFGAHTPETVRQRTSANTGCGTCLPDVENILDIYLK